MRQELLCLHDVAHFVGDFFKLFEKNVVRAIHNDLGEAGNGAALYVLALGLFNHSKRELLEMSLEQLQLLFAVLDAAEDVPFQLAQSLADDGMQLDGGLIPYLLLEIVENLRNERYQCILEDLRGHAKLLELLFHLPQIHVVVDLGQLVQEHVHALIVRDVGRHELLQLLRCLLLSMHLCKLLQCLE